MSIELGTNLLMAIPLVVGAGLLSGLSPCTLPTILLVSGYVSGRANLGRWQGFFISLFFVLGTAVTWSLLGAFAGFMGAQLANAWWFDLVISAVLLAMGLWLLGVLDFSWLGGAMRMQPQRNSGLFGALLLGLLMAVTASPCTLPVALSVLAYASEQGSPVQGVMLMTVFALGRGLPLILVGTFSAWLGRLERFFKYRQLIEKTIGWLMLVLGFYYLLG